MRSLPFVLALAAARAGWSIQVFVREVPIEAPLRPLLAALMDRGQPSDLLAPLLADYGEKHRAKTLQEHLRRAGVTRPGLFTSTATTMAANFRSCRDSGITWLALTGLETTRIMRRAGHDDPKTTLGYVKMAEDLKAKVGVLFPALPAELLGQASGQVHTDAQKPRGKRAPAAGLEPATRRLTAACSTD
jgi:hypothetical protein